MTKHELLDHFAGIALAELIKRDLLIKTPSDATHQQQKDYSKLVKETSAKDAYTYAIMMFKQRDAAHEWLNKQTTETQP